MGPAIHQKFPATFRRWSGKSYALFASMGRQIKIGILLVVYHLSSSAPANGQTHSSDTLLSLKQFELEEISVEGLRSPAVYSEAVRVVTVIRRETLQSAPATSLPEIFRHLSAIDIRQRGPEGIQADISLRGGSFDQTLIMVNGINVSDPQTGHHNLSLPVPHSAIDRIEILEGPGARLYGPNAFTGVINIVTEPGNSSRFQSRLVKGSYNFNEASLSTTYTAGRFSTLAAMEAKKSDGYINNTDFSTGNIYIQTRGKLAGGELDLQTSLLKKAFGANAFYTALYPDQFEETFTHLSSLRWTGKLLLPISVAAYSRSNSDRFELFRYDAPAWYAGHNYHRTRASGVYANLHLNHALGKTKAGIEVRNEFIESNVLGIPVEKPIRVRNSDAFYTRRTGRTGFSVFADHTVLLGNLQANAGIMAYQPDQSQRNWKFFPGIDLGLKLTEHWSWYSSAGKSLRLPTFTDLYYNGPTNTGNPELQPEEVVHIDSGIKLHAKGIRGLVSLFLQEGTNLIDWVKLPQEVKWSTMNHGKMVTTGISLQLEVIPTRVLGEKSFIKLISAGYTTHNLKREEQAYLSYYIADHLKHKFTSVLNHQIIRNLTAYWQLTYTSRNGSFTAYQLNQPVEMNYEPFWLLDGKLAWNIKRLELFLSASNLGNSGYYDFGNIPQAGRWMKFGIQYKTP